MLLHFYRRPRLVVLNPDSTLLEAARAIEHNRIGAIVVQEQGRIVGIVTDRDLAVRGLGRALDPRTTTISEVMTPSPITLTPSDSFEDAIGLMQERNIRRIPLIEGQQVVGMVTLDDLLLDEAAPLEELAAIVQAQIGEGGPAESPRLPARRRSIARAEATLARLVAQVREESGLESAQQARSALETVLASLVRRLTADEANDLISQLPSLLHPALRALPPGPDKSITRQSMEAELAQRLDVDPSRAGKLLAAVCRTIARAISRGQAEDVHNQLPADIREVFPVPAQPAASP